MHISTQKSRKNKVRMMTKNDSVSANTFYDAMTADTKNNGFDMLKVDFQSMNLIFNKGNENPILGVHYNNRALEENAVSYTHLTLPTILLV